VAPLREAIRADAVATYGAWVHWAVARTLTLFDGVPRVDPSAEPELCLRTAAEETEVEKEEERRASVWRNALEGDDRRHAEDIRAPEAGAFLHAVPMHAFGTVIPPEAFRRAVAHRLVGAEALRESLIHGTSCPRCHGLAADEAGYHTVGCCASYGTRHDDLKRVLREELERAGLPVETERTLEQIAERTGATPGALQAAKRAYEATRRTSDAVDEARPADLLLRWPSRDSAASHITAFDITVRSPFGEVARRTPAAAPAVLLGTEDKMKAAEALQLLGAECHPLVLSTGGRMSVRTLGFVKELAGRASAARGGSKSQHVTWLTQRLSVALQRANGEILSKVARLMREQVPEMAQEPA
jgi:hypothetical protein